MVFDFFRKRAEEGIDQLSNLADAAKAGNLNRGLIDVATYTQETNRAFASGLAKSRNKLLYDIDAMLNGGGDILEDLEDVLLQADLGIGTAEDVIEEIRSLRADSERVFTRDDVRSVLRGKLIEALDTPGKPSSITFAEQPIQQTGDDDDDDDNNNSNQVQNVQESNFKEHPYIPTVFFVMGANGMGKTTTIGKLAHRLRVEGQQKVLLAACDTFRAGAVDQLVAWADRAQVDCHVPSSSEDNKNEDRKKSTSPSSVVYSALDRAIRDRYDVLIVDTSGRLSNNDALTAELAKMKRVIQKRLSINTTTNTNEETGQKQQPILNTNVPHETFLVIDAAQGRMALDSARQWHKEIGITGLVLTKLDGSARGGSVVAISRDLGLPVKLIGVGERIDDLRDFDAQIFVDGLLGIGDAGGNNNNNNNQKNSNSKNEGELLAGRLNEMRRERDERAKNKNKKNNNNKRIPVSAATTTTISSSSSSLSSSPAGELTFQGMDFDDNDSDDDDNDGVTVLTGSTTTTTSTTKSSLKKSNKSKKKKKKKKKGKN